MACKATWSEFAGEPVGTILLDLLTTGTEMPLTDVSAKTETNVYSGCLVV
jgi:hypothetical protein